MTKRMTAVAALLLAACNPLDTSVGPDGSHASFQVPSLANSNVLVLVDGKPLPVAGVRHTTTASPFTITGATLSFAIVDAKDAVYTLVIRGTADATSPPTIASLRTGKFTFDGTNLTFYGNTFYSGTRLPDFFATVKSDTIVLDARLVSDSLGSTFKFIPGQ